VTYIQKKAMLQANTVKVMLYFSMMNDIFKGQKLKVLYSKEMYR